MAASNQLPDDAATSYGGLIWAILWPVISLGFVVVFVTLYSKSRESLVDIARNDRAIEESDAFPVNHAPWGYFVASHEITTTRLVLGTPANTQSGDVLMDAYRSETPKFLRPLMMRWDAYWTLIWPRLIVLAGLLPGLLVMAWGAWGYGAYLYALEQPSGKALSTLAFKNWKHGVSLCSALIFVYPVAPYPLSSWILALPMGMLLLCVVKYRRWRAS